MKTTKDKILVLLKAADAMGDVEGMNNLVNWLEDNDFFTIPASSKYHGNYEGGLADHCLNVFNMFWKFNTDFELDIPLRTCVLCSILHDVCKLIKPMDGHGKWSVNLLKSLINLTPLEEKIITYHMGMYGTLKYYDNFSLKEVMDAFNDKIVKLFHLSDDLACQFVDITK